MTDLNSTASRDDGSRIAAIATWVLYILSIPSANILVIVGLLVAYACRGNATGLIAQHFEAQINLFWSVFWWSAALWALIAVSFVASFLLIGIPFLFLFGLLLLLVSIWFTIKSVLGLLALLNDRPV